jgi:hypothetical protein
MPEAEAVSSLDWAAREAVETPEQAMESPGPQTLVAAEARATKGQHLAPAAQAS